MRKWSILRVFHGPSWQILNFFLMRPRISIGGSVRLTVHMSVHLYVHMSVHLYVHMSVPPSVSNSDFLPEIAQND